MGGIICKANIPIQYSLWLRDLKLFLQDGIAVNAIWPKTAIITAAMEMLGGGKDIASQCRKPDIMADAAYVILTRDARNFTGQNDIFIILR